MFPSLINENIYSNMNPKGFENISEIADSISGSDIMNIFMHKVTYNNEFDDIYAYMSVIIPIYYMKTVKYNKVEPIKFPVVLGKNAVIHANKMAIRSFFVSGVNYNIEQFILLRYKLLTLLENVDTIHDGIKYMIYYNITPDAIFASIKVKLFSKREFKILKNIKHKKLIKSVYSELSHS